MALFYKYQTYSRFSFMLVIYVFITISTISNTCHANETHTIEPIVITAELLDGNPQETPISVSPLSSKDIEQSDIASTSELQRRDASVIFKKVSVIGQPYIRAIGSAIFSIGTDSPISTYVDDVYQSRGVAAQQHFFDIERIEIIKGPQGALYGRNTTGGAFKIINKEPELELFSSSVDLQYGNLNHRKLVGVINAPLTKTTSFRLSGLTSQREGYIDVINTNETLGSQEHYSLRGQILAYPTDTIELLYRVDTHKDDGDTGNAAKVNPNFPAPQVDLFDAQLSNDPRKTYMDRLDGHSVELKGGSQSLIWDLEKYELTSITAFRESRYTMNFDIDTTDVDYAYHDNSYERSNTFTQEFRLSNLNESNAEWIAGMFYLQENADQEMDVKLNQINGRLLTTAENQAISYALFGQTRYSLNNQWRITAGGRYTYEEKEHRLSQGKTGPLLSQATRDWHNISPRLSLDYSPTEKLYSYFSISRGFKSGGFNSLGTGEEFDPEHIVSYEVGVKSTLRDGALTLNSSVFFYDYTDMQVQKFRPISGLIAVENAAEAEVSGFEAELATHHKTGLNIKAGLSYLSTKYINYQTINPNGDPNIEIDLSGNDLPNAPELSIFSGIYYATHISGLGSVNIVGEGKYQSHIYFDQFNTQGLEQGGYTVFNMRTELENSNATWKVALWVNNLTDKVYRENMIYSAPLFGALDFYGTPRTYGINIAYNF